MLVLSGESACCWYRGLCRLRQAHDMGRQFSDGNVIQVRGMLPYYMVGKYLV